CGIVGAVAQRDVAPILLEGLKRLEYRGYDSAGIAVMSQDGKLVRERAVGKVKELAAALEAKPLLGQTGIGHTRWATHGKPSEDNAHPMFSHGNIAVVHNGIIENHEELRETLLDLGYKFDSETDTEIVAHLLHHELKTEKEFVKAVIKTASQLEGAYALAIIDAQHPDQLIAVRSGSPLIIGLGIGENFLASDHLALLPVAQKFIYLEEGDVASITRNKVIIYDEKGKETSRKTKTLDLAHDVAERGQYRHYMLKEIFEQPEAISTTLEGRLGRHGISPEIFGVNAQKILSDINAIQITACGTSYHAGLVAKYWLEEVAGIPCNVEVASEWRYRTPVVQEKTLFLTLSQSGETADTLAAQKAAKSLGYSTLTICNVPESSLMRNADLSLLMHAGPEIGVASTKAFTSQLICLWMLTLILAKLRKNIDEATELELLDQLRKIPKKVEECLALDSKIQKLAELFDDKAHALFIGRGTQYPIALEGALKLKEISYIHAEGYPGGELKHGPLALLDKDMPVIVLAPNDRLLEKLKSNIQEIHSRGAPLIIFADSASKISKMDHADIFVMPESDPYLAPVLYTIPLQLLAYHVAVLKGTDVDQPRNLAKSVTVE
ncbi:MAG: glutamine--fructose-6-phosphate transaminase (isomerizing), partial [Gammaproteobacteria bacterium]|nr:glutamine--fructose-6-phosphate transaminase (isomerizing) [Gammaproteobacteria bacterium]